MATASTWQLSISQISGRMDPQIGRTLFMSVNVDVTPLLDINLPVMRHTRDRTHRERSRSCSLSVNTTQRN